jgi:uncharacterized protein (TIGR00369 family)
MSRISITEFEEIARERVQFAVQLGIKVEHLGEGEARARVPYRDDFLRPGGTIAGPVLMSLADFAMYGAVLSMIGPVELAVTTNLNINFLRRPLPGDVIAEARILKLGKRLAVGEVSLFRDGEDELVAHVTATYSIPPHNE